MEFLKYFYNSKRVRNGTKIDQMSFVVVPLGYFQFGKNQRGRYYIRFFNILHSIPIACEQSPGCYVYIYLGSK